MKKRIKRTLASLIAAIVCLMGTPMLPDYLSLTAGAEDGVLIYGDLTYVVNNKETITITDCDTAVTEVEIPAEIDGTAVTKIDAWTFTGCADMTAITVPESVTEIGSSAFLNCKSLTGITLPEGITEIDGFTFGSCISLTNVTLPAHVTKIQYNAFSDCTGLTSITIPQGVMEISYNAFYGCTGLTDVYYDGTEEQWGAITIQDGNDELTSATIHFNAVVESEHILGDVSGDNVINASDAAVVLIAAAQIGAGETSGLTEAQYKAADVNKDGKINASDAAIILIYAAAVGAGDEDVRIEDFVNGVQ